MLDLIPAILLACHGVAGLLMWRAWRGRGTGGKARCRRCWYDLSGNLPGICEPFVCPECGRLDIVRSGLLRGQRRYAALVVLVLLQWLIGYAWFLGENGRRGWLGLVPSAVLVHLVDDIESGTPLADSLAARWRADMLWPWHQKVYAGRMMDRWLAGIDPAARFVAHRRRVAVGEPLPIWLNSVWEGPALANLVLAVRPEQADAIAAAGGDVRRELDNYWMRRRVDLAPVRSGETSRRARVSLIAPILGGPNFVRRDITVRVEVEPVPMGEDVVRRVSDPALAASMREFVAISHKVGPRANGTAAHLLQLMPTGRSATGVAPRGCSLAIAYTIEHVGEHETRIIESGGFGRGWMAGRGRLALLDEPQWAPFYDPASRTLNTEGLVLRIRPNLLHALADFRAESVWDGQIEIRLDEIVIEKDWLVGPSVSGVGGAGW